MQAKLKMEEKSIGINVETSEIDAVLEEVQEKETELIILNEIWSMTERKEILEVSERCHFLNWRSENKQEFKRRRPWVSFLAKNEVFVPDPPRVLDVVVVPFVVVA